jgi:radical SAM superfamily enzyme YgiQ (UPF0313 family)
MVGGFSRKVRGVKVTFINPNFSAARSADAMEPLAFAVLSGLTPPDVARVFYDERVERLPLEEPTDLVALSVVTFTAKRAYGIAATYRSRGIPVVMGGPHPSLVPDEAASYADAVVIGDAEGAWPRLLDDLRRGHLQKRYSTDPKQALTGLVVDRTIFRGKQYLPISCVQFGRGCRFKCDFCCIHALYGNSRRTRPVAEVVEEIARLPRRLLFFVDDNLFLDHSSVRALMEMMIPLKVRWACQISLDGARDTGLVDLMRRSGCVAVYLGLESLDPASLAQMGKSQNLRLDYAQTVARFRDHGILVCGSFAFGYDADTRASIQAAVDFALRNMLCLAHFNILFPVPGTGFYARLHQEGRILYDPWWLSDVFQYGDCYFLPNRMSPQELEDAVFEARYRFNSLASILRRAMDLRANARGILRPVLYLFSNLINRREMLRKHGLHFG